MPQIIWLYKESLDLYRVGMKVPDDVTLGWTDDNYGYIRELPDAAEQKRAGGSGVYYHVSYWGSPHDYLWLCTTPPALIQEEMTKAYDHNARKYWILNVGDLKPAEIDIDYFLQLATDEPAMAKTSQREWLTQWAGEQFPAANVAAIADVMTRYYALNFIRKPEFMGFNGYNDGINRTAFNPDAWGGSVEDAEAFKDLGDSAMSRVAEKSQGDQDHFRLAQWWSLQFDESAILPKLPEADAGAYFELVQYPIQSSLAMNSKFLFTDQTFLDAHSHDDAALAIDQRAAADAYDSIQTLTAKYNALAGGKWDGIMSDMPRERHVFEMPKTATAADADTPLPAAWDAGSKACQSQGIAATGASGFAEQHCTVSMNAAHFTRSVDGTLARWNVLKDLGISGDSVVYGAPGALANLPQAKAALAVGEMPRLEYDFTTASRGPATLTIHLLPTFAVDSDHTLRFAVALDKLAPIDLDLSADATSKSAGAGDGPSGASWSANVLRNSAIETVTLGTLAPGKHTVRLYYRQPGVVFEHLVLTFPGAPPAYPVPPETR